MSLADFMKYVNDRDEKKKKLKEKGEKEAKSYSIENSLRINRRLSTERRRRNYKW
ncbi:hypothetical protein [Clostridium sp. YIM B02506]|uniref:hypothetical protein n=1 Tax=Clostridium sp. YIM B02506 TaxID=2910680 RepID=UPI001EEE781A|nr:hypothetical protein [Clostridium sp. YIM B02506]